jgi:hypothetical protein
MDSEMARYVLSVREALDLFGRPLPEGVADVIVEGSLDLAALHRGFLPRERLFVRGSLTIRGADWLDTLPRVTLVTERLDVSGSSITALRNVQVGKGLVACGCRRLLEVRVPSLGPFILDEESGDDESLTIACYEDASSSELSVPFVDLSGCAALEELVLVDEEVGLMVVLTGCERLVAARSRLAGDVHVELSGPSAPTWLDEVVVGGSLTIRGDSVTALGNLAVTGNLTLECPALRRLGVDELIVDGTLSLVRCDALEELASNVSLGRVVARLAGPDPPRWLKGLQVDGDLHLRGSRISALPAGVVVGGDLNLIETNVGVLGEGLRVRGDLLLCESALERLPADVHVDGTIDVSWCRRLSAVPHGFPAARVVRRG